MRIKAMSELDRMLELASHGTSRAPGQVPATRELKEGASVPLKKYSNSGDIQGKHDMKVPKHDGSSDDTYSSAPIQKRRRDASKDRTNEAVGEFAEPLYTLQDELGLEDNVLVDELARWMDGQDITEFVENFRRHHEMNDDMEESSVTEAKAKPDFADIDGDGDKDEDMKKAAKDKEDLDEAQSPAQKAAFAKMISSKGGKKADESDETDTDDKEELDESPTMDTTQLINLMKNSGLSEEAIETKLTEWANTPDGAAEEEATSHGEPYENFAQSVNLSLKRYLDAEDMKVGLKEHTVEDIKEAYKKSKG